MAKELITAATVNRIVNKETGECLGYLVKSNSNDDYYRITASKVNGTCHYFCTCRAGQNAFKNCKDGKCSHVKAVIEVVAARRKIAKEQGTPVTEAECLGGQVQGGVRSEHSPIDKIFADGLEQLDWQKKVLNLDDQVEPLDGNDALVSVTAIELIAQENVKAEAHQAVTAELKKAVFAELKQQLDYRHAQQVKPTPIAERGSLNGSRAFSLMR